MKFLSKHTVRISYIILLAFALASTGIAAVVTQCTMSADAMACCAEPMPAKTDGCDDPVPAHSGPSLEAVSVTCLTSTIVGGETTKPAVLEKSSKNDLRRVASLHAAVIQAIESPSLLNLRSGLSVESHPGTPHYLEKYILFSSLLI